ncbi:MAG: DUF1294 domain-containing protein [bacterium]
MDYYLIGINIVSFLMMGIDKFCAIKKKGRISEFNLFLVAIIFGSIGSILGMFVFHHKIRKTKFKVLMPLILLIHIYIFYKIF